MSTRGPNSFPVRVFAYIILVGGVISTAFDVYNRPEVAMPADLGIVIGNAALILLGLVTSAIASVLKNLETRLDRIERQGGSERTHVDHR